MATASATAFAAKKLTIEIEGEIVPECAISSATANPQNFALLIPDITKPGNAEMGFLVNCNAPFKYRLEAEHGALTLEHGARARKGFSYAVPYEIAMHIPTSGGAITDQCQGASIRANGATCHFSDSGNNIAIGSKGRLEVAWRPEAAAPIAGEYSDRITITVGVRQ